MPSLSIIRKKLTAFKAIIETKSITPYSLGSLLESLVAAIEETDLVKIGQAAEILIDNIGKPGGIAPLDSSGKVAAEYLPSYVDDVIEFAGIIDLGYQNFIGCFDEIPEPYAEYQFNATGNFLQYYKDESDAFYISGNGFVVGRIISVYNGHSEVAIFALNDPDIEKAPFGVIADNGCITPVKGKIYVDKSNDSQYRWSGSQLTMLSRPLILGENFNEAFPGTSGAQLRSKIESVETYADSWIGPIAEMLYGFGDFNINAYASYDDAFGDLQEAIDELPPSDMLNRLWWPSYGSVITFLSPTGWVRYRYTQTSEGEGDEGCYDPTNWTKIVESSGSGSSGTGSCSLCEQNASDIIALQSSVSQAKSTAISASHTASTAGTRASNALTQANANATAISQLQQALENITTSGADTSSDSCHQQFEFVNVLAEDSGCLAGAHNPSGLTYRYPSTKFNLKAVPTDGQDMLILTPIEPTLEGTVLRIFDPRIGIASTAPAVKISTYNNNSKIYGYTRESSDYYIALRGGYVELVAVNSNVNGTLAPGLHWVVRNIVKFS